MTKRLLVVGAGPAGASAALWARSIEMPVTLLEGETRLGGQLHLIHAAPPNLALGTRGEGPELARGLAAQLEAAGIAVRAGARAAALESEPLGVRTAEGERLEADAVIVATGVRRRRLEVPGERELEGRGVSFSATADRQRLAGQPVAVVGGGDAAYENALLLAEVGSRVTLLVRARPRARREFQERVAAAEIEVRERTRVRAVLGQDAVSGVEVEGPRGVEVLPVAGAVVKVGVIPNTEWCTGLERDADGFLQVDGRLRTSHLRVWAAGDVTRPAVLGLAVALGHGALAVAEVRAAFQAAS